MKIIDGTGLVAGRLASYTAKEALKGEEIAVVNCSDVIKRFFINTDKSVIV